MNTCKACQTPTEPLAMFPGGICLRCHAIRFDRELARTGILPRPNFTGTVQLGKRKASPMK